MSNTEESRPVELKATKAKTYKALVNKFVKSVGELSIELSRQKRKPRVSREDVYQALYLFLGERPATKPKMQFLVERRRLVARAYARNCRARRELRETIIRAALTATFQRGDETERSVDCDPAEESTMEVDRSSRSDSPKSTNTVEMRSVGSTESNELSAAVSSPKDSASEENGHSAGSNSKLSLNMDSASEKNGHSAESVSAAAFDENPKDTDADESAIQSLEGTGDEIDDKFSSRFSLEEAESLPDDNPESTNSGKDMGIEFENVPEKETGARARRKSEGDLPRPTEVDPVDQIATKLAGAGILTEPETPLPRSSKLVSKERPATLRTRTSDPPETPRVSAAPQTPPQASTSRKKRHESDYNEAYAAFIPHLGSPVTPPPGNRSPTERVMPSERMPEDLENVAGPSGIGRTRSPNTPPRESRLSRERSSPRRRVVHPEEDAAGLLENRGRSPTTPPRGIRSPRKRSRSTESTTDSSVTVASPSKKSPVTLRKHSSPSQAGGQNDDLGTPKPRRRLCDPEVTDSSSAEEATDS